MIRKVTAQPIMLTLPLGVWMHGEQRDALHIDYASAVPIAQLAEPAGELLVPRSHTCRKLLEIEGIIYIEV
jgi:hypothetical protein